MLARRFDWENIDEVYLAVNEERDIEPRGKGMYTFICYNVVGTKFIGSAFETTVGDMCEFKYWKIQRISSRKDPTKQISIVVKSTPPLASSGTRLKKPSRPEETPIPET